MADGFIVRRGGKATQQTIAPSILDFSIASPTSIKFKLRNNDAETATLVYRFSSLTGDGESISLATNTTSSEITLTGLTLPGTLFVTANATGKIKSNVVEQLFEIVYTAATGGTTNDYNLDGKRYRSHTFTSDGNFVVTTAGNGDRNQVDYLIIAGGGSGGGAFGGGGAGGYLTTIAPTPSDVTPETKPVVTATTYGVIVGAGGAGFSGIGDGNNGTNSSVAFTGTPTALGGGGGGGDSANAVGLNGGSGGGGSLRNSSAGGTGTSGQGRNGGTGNPNTLDADGGGGGGAGQVGFNAVNKTAGAGGDGLANLLRTGSNETRAGGGGGSSLANRGLGGSGGGGNGNLRGSVNMTSGTANTGGGGGGGDDTEGTSGAGGSGIVVIRYEIAPSV